MMGMLCICMYAMVCLLAVRFLVFPTLPDFPASSTTDDDAQDTQSTTPPLLSPNPTAVSPELVTSTTNTHPPTTRSLLRLITNDGRRSRRETGADPLFERTQTAVSPPRSHAVGCMYMVLVHRRRGQSKVMTNIIPLTKIYKYSRGGHAVSCAGTQQSVIYCIFGFPREIFRILPLSRCTTTMSRRPRASSPRPLPPRRHESDSDRCSLSATPPASSRQYLDNR